MEVNELNFNPLLVVFGYYGNHRHDYDSWDDRSASISGDGFFIKDVNYATSLRSEVNSGRDGLTTIEIYARVDRWLPNGFILKIGMWSNVSRTYSRLGIDKWYAFGI